MQRHHRIDGGETTIVWTEQAFGGPVVSYIGRRLPDDLNLESLLVASARGPRESTPDDPVPTTLCPISGWGWMGEPAVSVHVIDGPAGMLCWSEYSIERLGSILTANFVDARLGVEAGVNWSLSDTGVLRAFTTLRNVGKSRLQLSALASVAIPLPANLSEIIAFEGGWAREGQPHRFPAPPGLWSRVNRTGRTGFAGATACVAEPGASDHAGRVMALHLGWSGSHRLSVETLASGERVLMARADLQPGERILEPEAGFLISPGADIAFTERGFNGVSAAFHPFVRASVLPEPARKQRRVHFNSWEAVYFDLDQETLMDLAGAAADLGVERFVLDDGWFKGRRNDQSSLGDWIVDEHRFPEGIDPLIDHVHALGMDFGLWVEPEMVSPDSDLYRAHPDWCLHVPDAPQPTMRNQLWLDLSREDVRDHLFAALDALLTRHRIAYLKWDCNRDVFPAANDGGPVGLKQVNGTYGLLDRLRTAHPKLEIESCASGGARMDLGILRRTTRLWPSDTTDAIERLRIQRWAGLVFPPEVLGAHVGPSPNPITGRRLPMEMRARVAMFGHMGVEADPRRMSEDERAILADHIALWKRMRGLLATGQIRFWTTDDGADVRCVVAPDSSEAWLLACRAGVAPNPVSAPVRIGGLDEAASYRVVLLAPWPKLAARRLADPDGWRAGRVFPGSVLARAGLALPLTDPETAWLVRLERVQ